MVACGRSIKLLHHNAKTVFIGPCVAKKAEAKEKDVADAINYVLTFQEIQDIFNVADNLYVMDLLHRLGLDSIDALLEDTRIFSRHFDV